MIVKTLTLYQPWASLAAWEYKRLETRPRRMLYRGWLALHAAAGCPWSFPPELLQPLEAHYPRRNGLLLPLGAVLAVCRVADCLPITEEPTRHELVDLVSGAVTELTIPPPADAPEHRYGDYRPGRFALQLLDVHRLPEPVPAKGKQGIWHWTPPEELEAWLREVTGGELC